MRVTSVVRAAVALSAVGLVGCTALSNVASITGSRVSGTVRAPLSQTAALVFGGGASWKTIAAVGQEGAVASASVWVANYGTDGSDKLGITATCDAQGNYTLTGVPTGKVLVVWAKRTDDNGHTLTLSACLAASGLVSSRDLNTASTIVAMKAVRVDQSHFTKMTQDDFTKLEGDVGRAINTAQIPDFLGGAIDGSVFDSVLANGNLSGTTVTADQALLAK